MTSFPFYSIISWEANVRPGLETWWITTKVVFVENLLTSQLMKRNFLPFFGARECIIELVRSKPLDFTQSYKNLVHTLFFFKSNFNTYFPSNLHLRSRNKHFFRGRNVVGLRASKNKVNKPFTFNSECIAVRDFRTPFARKRGDCPYHCETRMSAVLLLVTGN